MLVGCEGVLLYHKQLQFTATIHLMANYPRQPTSQQSQYWKSTHTTICRHYITMFINFISCDPYHLSHIATESGNLFIQPHSNSSLAFFRSQ